MKVALVQTNPIVGAFEINVQNVLAWLEKATIHSCDLVIFPELTLCGSPPQDYLEREAFIKAHDQALEQVIEAVEDHITCIVGVLEQRDGPGKKLYNAAFVLSGGRVLYRARKQLLPNYDIFDETRYFEPGTESLVFPLQGYTFGLTLCEDICGQQDKYILNPLDTYTHGPVQPDCLINISASPYYHGKLRKRNLLFQRICRDRNRPLLFVNQTGGQDGLIFDGHSLVMNGQGRIVAAGKGFAEEMLIVDDLFAQDDVPGLVVEDCLEDVAEALCLGVRDYLHKTGFKKAVLGLSGGIDSALTAVVACRALGPDNVLCVAMPSPYTSQASIDDARQLAANLGCGFELLPIAGIMETYSKTLADLFADTEEDVTEQNIQARIRGNLLMAIANKTGALLLSTGNKSEMAVGYCTLYGDMSGGLAVLADVPKVMVYKLAHFFNKEQEVIPVRTITRPPTAELKPDQTDQDDLPAYEVLDPILCAYLEEQKSIEEIVGLGFDAHVVHDIVRRIQRNEYKRKQAPLGIKVTSKAFGHGRRYPVMQQFQE
ncbi:MAG: NAD+ synthase [Desulfobulbus propionicus]|nr:MAG: NAD+ synthase [Desulfobulbus propionicus]